MIYMVCSRPSWDEILVTDDLRDAINKAYELDGIIIDLNGDVIEY